MRITVCDLSDSRLDYTTFHENWQDKKRIREKKKYCRQGLCGSIFSIDQDFFLRYCSKLFIMSSSGPPVSSDTRITAAEAQRKAGKSS